MTGARLVRGAAWLIAAAGAAAQAMGPARAIEGGPFEASGAVHLAGTDTLLFVDDARPDAVFAMRIGPDGTQVGETAVVPTGLRVLDPEGITTDGRFVYVVGSQSRGPREGAGLVRFRYDGSRQRAEGAESISGLAALLEQNVPELRQQRGGKKGERELNVEGLAWDPKGQRLLLGLRAPLAAGRALLIPLALRDPKGAFAASNLAIGTALRLDLGGAGIRGIEHDPVGGGFRLIAGGVTGAGASRLVEWAGEGSSARVLASFPEDLKPEGVARAMLGSRARTIVLCDTSRYVTMD